jgi:hypothetical protein
MVMSALPPKADMCSALAHVCFGPIADIVAFRAWSVCALECPDIDALSLRRCAQVIGELSTIMP